MIDTIWSYTSIAVGAVVIAYLWAPIVRGWLVKRHQQTPHAN